MYPPSTGTFVEVIRKGDKYAVPDAPTKYGLADIARHIIRCLGTQ